MLTYVFDISVMGFEDVEEFQLAGVFVSIPYFDAVVYGCCEDAGAVEVDVEGDDFVAVSCIELLDYRHGR